MQGIIRVIFSIIPGDVAFDLFVRSTLIFDFALYLWCFKHLELWPRNWEYISQFGGNSDDLVPATKTELYSEWTIMVTLNSQPIV